jgi:hypothetical protein
VYPITYFVAIQGALLFQELNLPKGAILHLKGTNTDTTRDIIKKTLVEDGLDVVFVQFCNGGSEAWVRLQGENSSKEVCGLVSVMQPA